MKVLIICSGNGPAYRDFNLRIDQSFIIEQVECLENSDTIFNFYLIKGKGILGYLSNYVKLRKIISKNYQIIHAHNGISGLIANLQRKTPVVTTYHGSDINNFKLRLISYITILSSKQNIFVSNSQLSKLFYKKKANVIPCGVNLDIFYPMDKKNAIEKAKLNPNKKYILFASSFQNKIKNASLAFAALKLVKDQSIELIELKDRERVEVALLLNSCEFLLLTSYSEGSPQIIKEAMSTNCPIVSTAVGDVRIVMGNTEGCFITSFDKSDVFQKVKLALNFAEEKGRTNGRQRIIDLGLDGKTIARKVLKVYEKAIIS